MAMGLVSLLHSNRNFVFGANVNMSSLTISSRKGYMKVTAIYAWNSNNERACVWFFFFWLGLFHSTLEQRTPLYWILHKGEIIQYTWINIRRHFLFAANNYLGERNWLFFFSFNIIIKSVHAFQRRFELVFLLMSFWFSNSMRNATTHTHRLLRML